MKIHLNKDIGWNSLALGFKPRRLRLYFRSDSASSCLMRATPAMLFGYGSGLSSLESGPGSILAFGLSWTVSALDDRVLDVVDLEEEPLEVEGFELDSKYRFIFSKWFSRTVNCLRISSTWKAFIVWKCKKPFLKLSTHLTQTEAKMDFTGQLTKISSFTFIRFEFMVKWSSSSPVFSQSYKYENNFLVLQNHCNPIFWLTSTKAKSKLKLFGNQFDIKTRISLQKLFYWRKFTIVCCFHAKKLRFTWNALISWKKLLYCSSQCGDFKNFPPPTTI